MGERSSILKKEVSSLTIVDKITHVGNKFSPKEKSKWWKDQEKQKLQFKLGAIRTKNLDTTITIFTEHFDLSKKTKRAEPITFQKEACVKGVADVVAGADAAAAAAAGAAAGAPAGAGAPAAAGAPTEEDLKNVKFGFDDSDEGKETEVNYSGTSSDFERLYLGWIENPTIQMDDAYKKAVKKTIKDLFRFIFGKKTINEVTKFTQWYSKFRIAYTPLTIRDKLPCKNPAEEDLPVAPVAAAAAAPGAAPVAPAAEQNDSVLWEYFRESIKYRIKLAICELIDATEKITEGSLYVDNKKRLIVGLENISEMLNEKGECIVYGEEDLPGNRLDINHCLDCLDFFNDVDNLSSAQRAHLYKKLTGLMNKMRESRCAKYKNGSILQLLCEFDKKIRLMNGKDVVPDIPISQNHPMYQNIKSILFRTTQDKNDARALVISIIRGLEHYNKKHCPAPAAAAAGAPMVGGSRISFDDLKDSLNLYKPDKVQETIDRLKMFQKALNKNEDSNADSNEDSNTDLNEDSDDEFYCDTMLKLLMLTAKSDNFSAEKFLEIANRSLDELGQCPLVLGVLDKIINKALSVQEGHLPIDAEFPFLDEVFNNFHDEHKELLRSFIPMTYHVTSPEEFEEILGSKPFILHSKYPIQYEDDEIEIMPDEREKIGGVPMGLLVLLYLLAKRKMAMR